MDLQADLSTSESGTSDGSSFEGSEESDSSASESDIADLTQPKRNIMDHLPKDPKGHGQKKKHTGRKQIRTNWKNPLIFAVIREAQHEVGRINRNEHSGTQTYWSNFTTMKSWVI